MSMEFNRASWCGDQAWQELEGVEPGVWPTILMVTNPHPLALCRPTPLLTVEAYDEASSLGSLVRLNKLFKGTAPALVTCRHHPSRGMDTCRERTDSVVDLWVELEGVARLHPLSHCLLLSQVLVAA